MPSPRLSVWLLFALLGSAAAGASVARAEEVFVLDNGEVLCGWVVRQDQEVVRVRLLGFASEARVDIPRRRIVRRFTNVERPKEQEPAGLATDWSASTQHVELDTTPVPVQHAAPNLPAEEPPPGKESFFQRLARVAVLSVPRSAEGRLLMAGLLFAALLVLVTLGGRVAEVDALGLGRATVLALLLGGILAADLWFHDDVLRADRAIWVLPLQGAAWLATAMALLRVGVGRTVLLFAFVLFSVAVVTFTAGAILVSF